MLASVSNTSCGDYLARAVNFIRSSNIAGVDKQINANKLTIDQLLKLKTFFEANNQQIIIDITLPVISIASCLIGGHLLYKYYKNSNNANNNKNWFKRNKDIIGVGITLAFNFGLRRLYLRNMENALCKQ